MKRELMSWKECEKDYVRKVDLDLDKMSSILKMCKVRLRVLKEIKLDEETASIIADDYYEVIKELLTALMLLKGLKSSNHECLISFFKETYPDKEYETKLMHELKGVRNQIDYEGLFIEKSYIKRNELEFRHIIRFLMKEIEDKI